MQYGRLPDFSIIRNTSNICLLRQFPIDRKKGITYCFVKMQTVTEISRDKLIEQLVHHRQPPVFDLEINHFQNTLNGHKECDPGSIHKIFVAAFDKWIHNTKSNKISGLEAFEHRDFCVGVTGFLDDLYVRYGSKIAYLHREYSYHWRLAIGKQITDYRYLEPGDHLIISCPFSFYGDKHPDVDKILDYCDEKGISVHVDSAWYGCVRDFQFDYNRKCIQSVGFSLSKGLSSGHNRIGIRYSREREPGPITIANDFNMSISHLMWLGTKLMDKYSCDYLHEKYGESYTALCNYLDLTPTKAIHVAFGMHPVHQEQLPVGVGPILKGLFF